MAVLQNISNSQIHHALIGAADRSVPVTISIREDNVWRNLRSHLVVAEHERLFCEMPVSADSGASYRFATGQSVGLSFKFKHHKYLCTSSVTDLAESRLPSGLSDSAVALSWPTDMMRLQRRMYTRVDVPPNRIVRASFWAGSRDDEPAGESDAMPVWSGPVTNISAGGFQMKAPRDTAFSMDPGDLVGMRITFGAGQRSVYADAHFRRADETPQGVLLAFQFIGLDNSDRGRTALSTISEKVRQYQQVSPDTRS